MNTNEAEVLVPTDEQKSEFYRSAGYLVQRFCRIDSKFQKTGVFDGIMSNNSANADYLKNKLVDLFKHYSYGIPLEDEKMKKCMATVLDLGYFGIDKREYVKKYSNDFLLGYTDVQ